ncbi:MAG: leucyl aminopeptidase [Actinobacteria bacterium]|nr:MAG: leucyl aminopeptidase [Actinomycetota bacterium]
MAVSIEIALPGQLEADVLGIPVAEPVERLTGDGAHIVDEKLGGRLQRLAQTGDLRGGVGETLVLYTEGELRAPRVVLAGVGPRDRLDADALCTAAAASVQEAPAGTVMWLLDESLPLRVEEQAAALVEGSVLGAYDPGRWKTDRDERQRLRRVVLGHFDSDGLRAAADRAALVAERTNRARDLANAPPNELTPVLLAEHAERLASEHEHLTFAALGPAKIDELGMGAFSAVAQGSANEPRLIVLRYDPPRSSGSDAVLGLVGKAITFDSGGLSIKPAKSMEGMKGDMAGGGAVIEGTGAIAALGLAVRTIAVVAACENVIGPKAYKPGDILRAANGKSIEVINTDAEGRLVLADALWYARREGATHVLDVATLTGAMELALGDLYGGLFANDDDWGERVRGAAERSGDRAWPFPLHPRYRRYIDSAFADMKNASTLRQGSPALAAEFLHEFAGDGAWAHLDMSGPGFLERSRGDYMRVPGGTGWGVRLIAELAASLA